MHEGCLAIIPARGGSKGIHQKNIALVAGRPLLAWTISAALSANSIHRLILTTEDPHIANIARQFGVEVPFLRPSELARDDTPGIDPIIHAVNWMDEHQDYRPNFVIVLQPTSPLRNTGDIDAAVRLASKHRADSVVSVCPAHDHPSWMKKIVDSGQLVDFLSISNAYTCRQDLPPVYALNGAIYLARREILIERHTFYTGRTYAYVMPPERSLDIDTPWDLYLANLVLKDRMKHEPD